MQCSTWLNTVMLHCTLNQGFVWSFCTINPCICTFRIAHLDHFPFHSPTHPYFPPSSVKACICSSLFSSWSRLLIHFLHSYCFFIIISTLDYWSSYEHTYWFFDTTSRNSGECIRSRHDILYARGDQSHMVTISGRLFSVKHHTKRKISLLEYALSRRSFDIRCNTQPFCTHIVHELYSLVLQWLTVHILLFLYQLTIKFVHSSHPISRF